MFKNHKMNRNNLILRKYNNRNNPIKGIKLKIKSKEQSINLINKIINN